MTARPALRRLALIAGALCVRNGPCAVAGVRFNDRLSGPGPDCLVDDAACTVFRGEPARS